MAQGSTGGQNRVRSIGPVRPALVPICWVRSGSMPSRPGRWQRLSIAYPTSRREHPTVSTIVAFQRLILSPPSETASEGIALMASQSRQEAHRCVLAAIRYPRRGGTLTSVELCRIVNSVFDADQRNAGFAWGLLAVCDSLTGGRLCPTCTRSW